MAVTGGDSAAEIDLCACSEIADNGTRSFTFSDPATGIVSDGFVLRYGGRLYAYKNMCRHQPLTLDYGDGDFLTDDLRYILCRNHGALFEPESGMCVAGPCTGAALFSLNVAEKYDRVIVTIAASAMELE